MGNEGDTSLKEGDTPFPYPADQGVWDGFVTVAVLYKYVPVTVTVQ